VTTGRGRAAATNAAEQAAIAAAAAASLQHGQSHAAIVEMGTAQRTAPLQQLATDWGMSAPQASAPALAVRTVALPAAAVPAVPP
jgi:hypothetical protein